MLIELQIDICPTLLAFETSNRNLSRFAENETFNFDFMPFFPSFHSFPWKCFPEKLCQEEKGGSFARYWNNFFYFIVYVAIDPKAYDPFSIDLNCLFVFGLVKIPFLWYFPGKPPSSSSMGIEGKNKQNGKRKKKQKLPPKMSWNGRSARPVKREAENVDDRRLTSACRQPPSSYIFESRERATTLLQKCILGSSRLLYIIQHRMENWMFGTGRSDVDRKVLSLSVQKGLNARGSFNGLAERSHTNTHTHLESGNFLNRVVNAQGQL